MSSPTGFAGAFGGSGSYDFGGQATAGSQVSFSPSTGGDSNMILIAALVMVAIVVVFALRK